MKLARELAERPLDVGVRRSALDAEDLVVVALGRRQGRQGYGSRGQRLLVLVDVFDEARELERGRADGANRLVVVHPQRPEQRDRAQRACRHPVRGADEGDVVELVAVDFGADANDRPTRVESVSRESSTAARRSRTSSRLWQASSSAPRMSPSRPAAPPTKSCGPASATASTKAGRSRSRNARSLARRSVPRAGAGAWPCRTGARRGRRDTRGPSRRAPRRSAPRPRTPLRTPPADVIRTTITTRCWSRSTSTWRTEAARATVPRRGRAVASPGRATPWSTAVPPRARSAVATSNGAGWPARPRRRAALRRAGSRSRSEHAPPRCVDE